MWPWGQWSEVKVAQSCPTLCDPVDYTVHGILQARILKSVAFPFSRGSSQPRDWTQVSHIAGSFFTSWATREAQEYWSGQPIPFPADLPNTGIEPGTETGLIQPKAKDGLKSSEEPWNRFSPWAFRGTWLCQHLGFNLLASIQTILQSYSNQNSMVLAQRQIYGSMELMKEPRNKPTHLLFN